MSQYTELELSLEDHQVAFTETSFLVEILVHTIDDLMGGASGTVGINAGRLMGRKLPIYLEDRELGPALEALAVRFGAGFEIKVVVDESGEAAEMHFGKCAIREVCKNRGVEPGGQLCKTFHTYLAGIVTEMLKAPMRARITEAGDTCTAEIEYR